jgi:CRP/FNR family cyclic AMP-dependent transcriptional regulator
MSLAYNLLVESKEKIQYSPGDAIFKEGDEGDFMYVVLEGEVLIIAGGQVVDELSKGDLFGEMALIDSSPRSATATAKSACTLAPLDQANFMFLLQHAPYFSIHVMSVMAERLRKMLTITG